MNTDMLRNLLYKYRDSPDLLLEAYKRGCRDEREAAKHRLSREHCEARDRLAEECAQLRADRDVLRDWDHKHRQEIGELKDRLEAYEEVVSLIRRELEEK